MGVRALLTLRNERHVAYTAELGGSWRNAEGLADRLIGWMLRDGPELARARAQLLLPSFAPGVKCALAFFGESAPVPLLTVGVTTLIYEALGVDCGTASKAFAPYMLRVDPDELLNRYRRWTWGLFARCIEADGPEAGRVGAGLLRRWGGLRARRNGAPKAWRIVAGMLPTETLPPVVPGQTFEFNTQGLLRYLAAAMEQRVPVAHVLPAYRDYLKHFETLCSAAEACFETLFCVAVLVHHRIGGHPITAVPALLHQDHLANVEEVPDEASADAKA